MPIDPSIPLGVKPFQTQNPLQMLMQVESLRQMQRQGQSQEQDRALRQQEIDLRKQTMTSNSEAATKKAEAERMARLQQRIVALKAVPSEQRAELYQAVLTEAVQSGDLNPNDPDVPKVYPGDPWLEMTHARMLSPDKLEDKTAPPKKQAPIHVGDQLVDPETFQPVFTAPQKATPAAGFTLNAGDTRYDANGQVIASRPAAPPAQSTSRSWVLRDGRPVRVSESEIRPGDAPFSANAGGGRPSSGQEKRALNFFNRARQADTDIEGIEDQIQNMNTAEQYRMKYSPNVLQSDTGQSYTQAQRAFTEARLRKDSGAAIPDHEYSNDRKTYFAQPGDSKATLSQKRRARAAVLASLGFEAGKALGEFEGDADAATSLIEGYKARSAKTDDKADAEGWTTVGGIRVREKK